MIRKFAPNNQMLKFAREGGPFPGETEQWKSYHILLNGDLKSIEHAIFAMGSITAALSYLGTELDPPQSIVHVYPVEWSFNRLQPWQLIPPAMLQPHGVDPLHDYAAIEVSEEDFGYVDALFAAFYVSDGSLKLVWPDRNVYVTLQDYWLNLYCHPDQDASVINYFKSPTNPARGKWHLEVA